MNNLGGTPTMELAIVARRALALLEGKGTTVERAYLGTFLSALEMAGVALSLLPLDDERLARLDALTDAPAWPNAAARPRTGQTPSSAPVPPDDRPPALGPPQTLLGRRLRIALDAAAKALIEASPRLTQLDQAAGDGDLGISLERGAKAIQESLSTYPLDDPAATLAALGVTLRCRIWAAPPAGPLLYAAFFLRAGGGLKRGQPEDANAWAAASGSGCDRHLAELGGAARGDRTMLDARILAAEAFASSISSRAPA